MKRFIILIVVLALVCAALCGCSVRDGFITDKNGTDTDNSGKDKNTNTNDNSSDKNVTPRQTAIPGTQAITP